MKGGSRAGRGDRPACSGRNILILTPNASRSDAIVG